MYKHILETSGLFKNVILMFLNFCAFLIAHLLVIKVIRECLSYMDVPKYRFSYFFNILFCFLFYFLICF